MKRPYAVLAVFPAAAVVIFAVTQLLGTPQPSGWANGAEMRWIAAAGRVADRLTAHAEDSSARCEAVLASLDPPPTKRLAPVVTKLAGACRASRPSRRIDLIARALEAAVVGANRTLPSYEGILDATQGDIGRSHTDPLFNRAASAVTRKPVSVRCWSSADWTRLTSELDAATNRAGHFERDAGFAVAGGNAVDLAPDVCSQLNTAADGGLRPGGDSGLGFALDVLAHEAEHAHGYSNEAQTECYAIQEIPVVARALGASPGAGRYYARAVWKRYDKEAQGYSTPLCRDGGVLDLHPDSSVWP